MEKERRKIGIERWKYRNKEREKDAKIDIWKDRKM